MGLLILCSHLANVEPSLKVIGRLLMIVYSGVFSCMSWLTRDYILLIHLVKAAAV